MSERWVFGILTAAVLTLALARPMTAWPLHSFWSSSGTSADQTAIELSALKAEVTVLGDLKTHLPTRFTGTPAMIYVRYPFNFKDEVLVSAGSAKGVAVGDKVVVPAGEGKAETGVLFGKVVQVFQDSALVQTLFDPDFQVGVRIGPAGEQALLKGGSEPLLTLIPKTAAVHGGEIVYAASRDYAYGLAIGSVNTVVPTRGGLLQEATLKFPYDISELRAVLITK
jgi:cell shape-determining protein MreC